MSERKTRKHPQYTIEQKNAIVKSYLNQEMGWCETLQRYDINNGVFQRWLRQYRQHGTTIDNRGRGSKRNIPGIGRPKSINFELMTKEELIEYIKVGEAIKKAVAYLRKR